MVKCILTSITLCKIAHVVFDDKESYAMNLSSERPE